MDDRLSVTALTLVPSSVSHLRPEESVWAAMLSGWAAQMRSRALGATTVEPRLAMVRGSSRSTTSIRGSGVRLT